METFVTVIHIFVCLFLVFIVLIQGGSQGGISATFGGGNSQGVFGATGATSLLAKITYGAAAVFMITSISLSILMGRGGSIGLGEKLKEKTSQTSQQQPESTPSN
jgi:preprotein translocase subunit SecG